MSANGYHFSTWIGLFVVLFVVCLVVFAPLITQDPNRIDLVNRFAKPSSSHPFGQDHFGRDMWSRAVFGARQSLGVSFSAVLVATLLGSILGVTAAYLGGWVDRLFMRIIDALIAFPSIILAIYIQLVLGSGGGGLMLTLAFIYIPIFARTSRSSVLVEKGKPYIEAAVVVGLRSVSIVHRHILRNIFAPLIILVSASFADAIVTEASLTFLGLGASPLTPSWGGMLADGKRFLPTYPHLVVLPGAMIVLTVVGVHLLINGLRSKLYP